MIYVRNAWYVAGWAHELAAEGLASVRILNEPIVIWRDAAGGLAAFEDRCVHRLAPLSLGRCEGERLRCMYHGLLYDRAGRVIEIPGQDRIPANLRIRSYPVLERHSWIWVWMGTAAEADEALIPPVVGMDRTDYIFAHGQLDFAAEARLIYENLLDLSHISFLHSESLRHGEIWARERPKVTEHERSIRSERWFRSGSLNNENTEEARDIYYYWDSYIPGVVISYSNTYPVGSADALNGDAPELNQAARTYTASHAITPLTDRTSRQFYILAGPHRGNETVLQATRELQALLEDKTMIEAQQRNIDITPDRRFIPITADRAVILFNRLVEKQMITASSGS